MSIKSNLFLSLLFALAFKSYAEEYDYHEQSRWYDQYEECSLYRQSPIELNSMDAVILTDMPEISFKHYGIPYTQPAKCENNGHTINIQLPKPKSYAGSLWQIYDKLLPHIAGGPFPPKQSYIAESVHFHWGSRDTHGSEHVIDSKRYAMEMHILHRNSNYSTVEEARGHEDGLAVIAVLFKVQSSALTPDFLGLNPIITAMDHIAKFSESAEIKNFTLSSLFKSLNSTEFFTYAGSLTTPPCSQAVTWLIFSQPIEIPHSQMERFHYIMDASDAIMENNYRSLQAKGNRKVYKREVLKVETTTKMEETAETTTDLETETATQVLIETTTSNNRASLTAVDNLS